MDSQEALAQTPKSELKDGLKGKLHEIYEILRTKHHQVKDLGVLSGTSGIALFYFLYAKFMNDDRPADLGEELLTDCIIKINEGYDSPTYCNGMAGTGWVIDHLKTLDLLDAENDELLSGLDEYLAAVMDANMERGYYDFLHGAGGYAFYFMKRYKVTESEALKATYAQYLNNYLDALTERAEQDGNGLKWRTQLRITSDEMGYNLSLSHGMSSIINLCAFSFCSEYLLNSIEQY